MAVMAQWKLAFFMSCLLCSTLGHSDQILVRSHGQNAKSASTAQSFEAVLGLDVVPRNVIRVRARSNHGDNDDMIENEAVKAALVAESQRSNAGEIPQQLKNPAYRDLDPEESSLQPVS